MVREGGDEWLGLCREEFGEGESFAGIAPERAGLRRVQVGEDFLVESEVGPAGEETEDGEVKGCAREERGQGEYRDDGNVEKGESRNSKGEDASEESNGMSRYELTEGDEEGDL